MLNKIINSENYKKKTALCNNIKLPNLNTHYKDDIYFLKITIELKIKHLISYHFQYHQHSVH